MGVILHETTGGDEDRLKIILFGIGFNGGEDLGGFARAGETGDADKMVVLGGGEGEILYNFG